VVALPVADCLEELHRLPRLGLRSLIPADSIPIRRPTPAVNAVARRLLAGMLDRRLGESDVSLGRWSAPMEPWHPRRSPEAFERAVLPPGTRVRQSVSPSTRDASKLSSTPPISEEDPRGASRGPRECVSPTGVESGPAVSHPRHVTC
jgi:hypothetical protein